MKRYLNLFVVLMALLVVFSGCSREKPEGESVSPGEKTEAPAETSSPAEQERTNRIVVYYADKDALYLHPFEFEVPAGKDRIEFILEKLFETNAPDGFLNTVPEHMSKPKIKIEGDTAFVDFTSSDIEFYPKGSTGENLFIYSIVNSLTGSLGVKYVVFTVDGERRAIEGSNYDFSIQRFEFNKESVATN